MTWYRWPWVSRSGAIPSGSCIRFWAEVRRVASKTEALGGVVGGSEYALLCGCACGGTGDESIRFTHVDHNIFLSVVQTTIWITGALEIVKGGS